MHHCRDGEPVAAPKTTRGAWSQKEATLHINRLELLAATLAVQSFVKSKSKLNILLRIDNTTAVAYTCINHLGGDSFKRLDRSDEEPVDVVPGEEHTHHSPTPPRVPEHHCGCRITVTDRQTGSCPLSCSTKYSKHPLEVDLFATRLSAECRCYFSWWPDPSAEATDAFLQVWTHIKGYAKPPWNLVGRTLAQVQSQQANLVLVAPVWRSQPWYPTLLHMLVDYPRLIISGTEIMVNRDSSLMLPQLAVWHISGRDTDVSSFQRKLQTSCLVPGLLKLTSPMTHFSPNGTVGVLNGIQIFWSYSSGGQLLGIPLQGSV